MQFYLDYIEELENSIFNEVVRAILNATDPTPDQCKFFTNVKILDEVEAIREIINHPSPQNRSESNPYLPPHRNRNLVVYKNNQGEIGYETAGLLGLTSRNDNTAFPVTKFAVIKYIHVLIMQMIDKKVLSSDEKQLLENLMKEQLNGIQSEEETSLRTTISRQGGSIQTNRGNRVDNSSPYYRQSFIGSVPQLGVTEFYLNATILKLQVLGKDTDKEYIEQNCQFSDLEENKVFDRNRHRAIIYFVSGRLEQTPLENPDNLSLLQTPLTVEQAVAEISTLQTLQIELLIKYFNLGLRGTHFRQWNESLKKPFSYEYSQLLVTLLDGAIVTVDVSMELLIAMSVEGIEEVDHRRISPSC